MQESYIRILSLSHKIFLPLDKNGVFLHASGIFGRKGSAVWQTSDNQGVSRNTNTAAPGPVALLSCFHDLWLFQTCGFGTHLSSACFPQFLSLPTNHSQTQQSIATVLFLPSCSCCFPAVTHRGWSIQPSLPAAPGSFQQTNSAHPTTFCTQQKMVPSHILVLEHHLPCVCLDVRSIP